jgi:hypothetical protein
MLLTVDVLDSPLVLTRKPRDGCFFCTSVVVITVGAKVETSAPIALGWGPRHAATALQLNVAAHGVHSMRRCILVSCKGSKCIPRVRESSITTILVHTKHIYAYAEDMREQGDVTFHQSH